ncbi:hypothetical protein [Cyclobacterium plantarum]|uniref:Uncharacterized protein n=1 Tax=Cyclobacterium plantarum TaxID=2716263 RepID=A0ABX0HE78_9BACT|nr:hypothetical protein [Cyclobacterium plantarum]NHE58477.1 hypothetical protein [Cyclobacterium plantarum]
MILTLIGSIGFLAAFPSPEQEKEVVANSKEKIDMSNEGYSFDELDEKIATNPIHKLDPKFY